MLKYLTVVLLLMITGNFCFSQTDHIKSLVEETNGLDLDIWELVDYAKTNLNSDEELSRFFYYWIGGNIRYDHELLAQVEQGTVTNETFFESQDYYQVYQNRKAVCAGYAGLYEWFMFELDIEVAVISGHIRDERNHYLELEADAAFRHAWNAVKLNGNWILLDSTWGTSGEQEVSDYYFDIKPEWSIITHYPEEPKWQLLQNPLTLEEFNRSKFIKPYWFQIGFSDIPVLKEDDTYYYLVYKSNPDKKWSVQLLLSTDNYNYDFINQTKEIVQDGFTYVRFEKTGIPRNAYYKMDLIYMDVENENSYSIFNVFYFKT